MSKFIEFERKMLKLNSEKAEMALTFSLSGVEASVEADDETGWSNIVVSSDGNRHGNPTSITLSQMQADGLRRWLSDILD